eukprot:scaffold187018_cov31-Tisochrysis_lutea.AAC.2
MERESTTAMQKKYMHVSPRRRSETERSDCGSSSGESTEWPSSDAMLSQSEEQLSELGELCPSPGTPNPDSLPASRSSWRDR